ncbi:MAG: hypothetical protein ACJAYU_002542 [Bradymonadia bacterium]|jgi:hypothetical protein
MDKVSNAAGKALTATELQGRVSIQEASGNVAAGASIVSAGADVARGMSDAADVTEFAENMEMFDRAARFSDHLFGDQNHAQTGVGAVFVAAAKTGSEELASHLLDTLPAGRFSSPLGAISSVVGSLNDAVDVDSPFKLLTQSAAEIQPGAQIDGGIGLAIDTATVLTAGDLASIEAGLEAINADALAGEYGVVAQTASMTSNLLTEFDHTADLLTGDAAENGDLGVFVGAGNDLGDHIFDVTNSRNESDWEFRPDA